MRSLTSILIVMLFIVPAPVLAHGPSTLVQSHSDISTTLDQGLPAILERIEVRFDGPIIIPGSGPARTSTVTVDGTATLDRPGLPRVPVRTITKEFPAGTMVVDVRAFYGPPTTTPLSSAIEMAPPVYPIGPNGPMLDTPVEMYFDGNMFPADWFAYDVSRGLNKEGEPTIFVNMFTYPVRVEITEVGQRLWSIDELTIEIEHTPPADGASRDEGTDQYEMVLIGPAGFVGDLQTLADHKEATGVTCKVVSTIEIYSGEHFAVQGRDSAEKMKYFIKDAIENWGTRFVLFGGDIDKVPSRHTLVVDGYDDDAGLHLDGQWVLSDAYFGDIYNGTNQFSSWDENGNNTFGEWLGGRNGTAADDPDYHLDVYIGRLPASTVTELKDMIDKVIKYENATEWGWYSKATIAALDIFYPPIDDVNMSEGEYSGDLLAADLTAKGYTVQKLYESQGTLSSSTINAAINNGRGLVSMIGHGTFAAWGSNQVLYYQNTNIAALSNGVKLPVGHQASCLTAAFDNEAPAYYPGPTQVDSMGEEFVKKKNGGHIANMGYSRVAYGGKAWDHPNMTSGYMNGALFDVLSDGPTTPGEAFHLAREDCLQEFGVSFVGDYKHMAAFTLFGDPSTALGGVGLTISADRSAVRLLPGGTATVNLTIRNVGAYDTSVDLSLTDQGGQWTANLGTTDLVLVKGQTKEVPLIIGVADGALAGNITEFTILAVSSANGRSVYTKVNALVDRVYGLDLEVAESLMVISPGDNASFKIDVNNMGNGQEDAVLAVSATPQDWGAALSVLSLALDANSSTSSYLNITSPDEAMVGTYTFTVEGTIVGTSITDTIELQVDIGLVHSLTAYFLSYGQEAKPGSSAELPFTIINEGNVEENVTVGPVKIDTNWTSYVPHPYVIVPPYSTVFENITLIVDEWALADQHEVLVDLTTEEENITLKMRFTVAAVHSIEVIQQEQAEPLVDGKTTPCKVWINNTGNIPENVQIDDIELPKGWKADYDNSSHDLWPRRTGWPDPGIEAILNVTVPLGTPEGIYTMTITVLGDNDLTVKKALEVTVASRPEGKATLTQGTDTAKPGTQVTNTVTFKNTGNIADTVRLSMGNIEGATVLLKGDNNTVQPGSSVEMSFVISIPDDALAGAIHYTILVEREEAEDITVYGSIRVETVPGVDTTTTKVGDREWKVVVKNTGNLEDNFTVIVRSDQAKWISVSEQAFILGPGETKEVTVKARPPAGASSGTYDFDILVTSVGGATTSDRFDFKVTASTMATSAGGAVSLAILGIVVALVVLIVLMNIKREGAVDDEGSEYDDPGADDREDQVHGRSKEEE